MNGDWHNVNFAKEIAYKITFQNFPQYIAIAHKKVMCSLRPSLLIFPAHKQSTILIVFLNIL